MNKSKFFTGLVIVLFNICVYLFTQSEINPEYFEALFAIYWAFSSVWGVWLIITGVRKK